MDRPQVVEVGERPAVVVARGDQPLGDVDVGLERHPQVGGGGDAVVVEQQHLDVGAVDAAAQALKPRPLQRPPLARAWQLNGPGRRRPGRRRRSASGCPRRRRPRSRAGQGRAARAAAPGPARRPRGRRSSSPARSAVVAAARRRRRARRRARAQPTQAASSASSGRLQAATISCCKVRSSRAGRPHGRGAGSDRPRGRRHARSPRARRGRRCRRECGGRGARSRRSRAP